MEMINRVAVVLTPRRRFFDWVNALPEAGTPLSYENRKDLRQVFLTAGGDDETVDDLIDSNWDDLFTAELSAWEVDDELWPSNRTAHIFRDWFEVDVIDAVADLDPAEPFTVAEQARTRCAACGTELDDSQIAVALQQDGGTVRWTREQVDEWEEEDDEEDEDADDPGAIVVAIRTCSEPCADRIEGTIQAAAEQE